MNKTSWNEIIYHVGEESIGHHTIKELVHNDLSVIVLKNILDTESLSRCQTAIEEYRSKAETKKYNNGTLTTIGPYLMRYINNPETYFERAAETDNIFSEAYFDLRRQVRNSLKRIFNFESISIANQSGQSYAPAIIRLHGDGISNPLHNDMIARDSKNTDLILKKVVAQLSCVVCIQECTSGGELVLYRKGWDPGDERYKVQQGLGYLDGVVENSEFIRFKPETGDVYVFNPTNYHSIDTVHGIERRTMGFFIGFYNSNLENPIVWS